MFVAFALSRYLGVVPRACFLFRCSCGCLVLLGVRCRCSVVVVVFVLWAFLFCFVCLRCFRWRAVRVCRCSDAVSLLRLLCGVIVRCGWMFLLLFMVLIRRELFVGVGDAGFISRLV